MWSLTRHLMWSLTRNSKITFFNWNKISSKQKKTSTQIKYTFNLTFIHLLLQIILSISVLNFDLLLVNSFNCLFSLFFLLQGTCEALSSGFVVFRFVFANYGNLFFIMLLSVLSRCSISSRCSSKFSSSRC
jgi:hypothetical protein